MSAWEYRRCGLVYKQSETSATCWVTMLQPCEDNRIVPRRNRLGHAGHQADSQTGDRSRMEIRADAWEQAGSWPRRSEF